MVAALDLAVLRGGGLLHLGLPHHRVLLRPSNLGLRANGRLDLGRNRSRDIYRISRRRLLLLRYDVLTQSLFGRSFDSAAHFAELAYLRQARFLEFLINRLLRFRDRQRVGRVLMLRFRHWDVILVIARGRMLVVQVEAVLLHALVRRLHHDGLHVVRVTDECHLLGVHRLLLRHFTRLHCDALLLDVHGRAGGVLVGTHRLHGAASLGTLLLSEAHIFRLHHVRGHAQRLLVTTMSAASRANGLHFGLLHGHHV